MTARTIDSIRNDIALMRGDAEGRNQKMNANAELNEALHAGQLLGQQALGDQRSAALSAMNGALGGGDVGSMLQGILGSVLQTVASMIPGLGPVMGMLGMGGKGGGRGGGK